MRLFAATEHRQERRPSARRGGVTHLQRRQRDTAGLRQPLLGVMTAAAREMRIPLRIRHVHHDWLTPAAAGARCRFARKTPVGLHTSFRRKNAIRGAQTHVFEERRPSARRGDVTHLQRRQHDTANSRQPLLCTTFFRSNMGAFHNRRCLCNRTYKGGRLSCPRTFRGPDREPWMLKRSTSLSFIRIDRTLAWA